MRILLLSLFVISAFAGPIPADRITTWGSGNVGVYGGINTGRTQFCNITVSIPGSTNVAVGDGVTDDYAAFNSANTLCPTNGYVYVPAGSYKLSTYIGNRSGTVFKGAGMGQTILKGYGSGGVYRQYLSSQGNERLIGIYAPNTVVVTNGQTSISLMSTPTSLQVGNWFVISQNSTNTFVNPVGVEGNWSGATTYPISTPASNIVVLAGQMVKATSITATNVGFDPPYMGITLTNTYVPVIYYWTTGSSVNCYENWGLEDLTLENSLGNSMTYSVDVHRAANGYLKQVEIKNFRSAGFYVLLSSRITIENCFFNGSIINTPGGGYGVELQSATSAMLMQNSIYHGARVPFICEGGTANVFAWNFGANITNYDSNLPKNPSVHACFPMFNLLEGNIATRMGADNTHGSSAFNTFYRNWGMATNIWQASPATTGYRIAVNNDRRALYNNYVANILGYPGNTYDTYTNVANTATRTSSTRSIFSVGYTTDSDGSSGGDSDAFTSMEIHGNYDFYNNGIIYDGSNASNYFPESLYLSAKPSTWGGNWPAIGINTNGVGVVSITTNGLVNSAALTWSNYLATSTWTWDWSGGGGGGTTGGTGGGSGTYKAASIGKVKVIGKGNTK